MQNKKTATALKICHLYYDDGLSQNEIAKIIGISRPTVSRLLQYSHETGLVKIEIADPATDLDVLSKQLETKYNLKKVLIAYDISDNYAAINEKIGQLAAEYLDEIVQNGYSIGISWGKTINAVANNLKTSEKSNIKVVQLKGSVASSDMNNFATEILEKFGKAFQTNAINLPLPVIFDNATTKQIVLEDRFIKKIIDEGKKTNIALFTCGTVRNDALLFNLGYLNQKEITQLQKNSVGDVMSRFITKDGKIANQTINDRTVGSDLDELKNKDYSILVAGSMKKVSSIKGALAGNYANVLITDYGVAQKLLSE
ncbi:sugar-binding transcriptional regulator [Companilactobacillus furfuricola]|uniref:sugar-binding transcriptional regulator n=1 Tax=Companilactobacillus furfuricola TaxID=1462575 RepID=UPI000F78FF56|nr:sugar-binding transcriptional regulator [Companilactobacillus furfuricola]